MPYVLSHPSSLGFGTLEMSIKNKMAHNLIHNFIKDVVVKCTEFEIASQVSFHSWEAEIWAENKDP